MGPPEETVAQINEKWNRAFNSGDAEGLAALYAPDAVVSPGNGQVVQGRDAIRDLFQAFIDSGAGNHELTPVVVGSKGPGLHQVAEWSALGGEQDGERPAFGGIMMNVYERDPQTGEWLSQSHVWNTGG
ncbi:hypothetical protein C882_2921 [Caenispirillum salinarum AK4]|uniref:SnoaL-like domain-containing protein n=2 Tax=Caenispirillum TaxID=414051 RepID=K9H6D9_9PROT|nr:hypothetical protein C882_2921 [Caenispirillum salinarum AK4]